MSNDIKDIGPYNLQTVNNGANQDLLSPFYPFGSTATHSFTTESSTELVLGVQDFTLQTYIYQKTDLNTRRQILGSGTLNSNNDFRLLSNDIIAPDKYSVVSFSFDPTLTTPLLVSDSDIMYSRWVHIAVVRSGNAFALFINGVREAVNNWSGSLTVDATVGWAGNFLGYYSNLRLDIGTAVYSPYSSSIVIPTEPLEPIAQTKLLFFKKVEYPRDYSANNIAFIMTTNTVNANWDLQQFNPLVPESEYPTVREPWSAFFATPASISVYDETAFLFNENDFTLELSVFTESGALNLYCEKYSTSDAIRLYVDKSQVFANQLRLDVNGVNVMSGEGLTDNVWTHLVVAREGQTLRLFKDSTLIGTFTDTNDHEFDHVALIKTGVENFSGYIQDLRVVKGTAVYTTEAVAPTAPLTAITGTVLLTCNQSALIDQSNENLFVERLGHVVPIRKAPFTVEDILYLPDILTGSIACSATSSMVVPASPDLVIGSNDFIIEMFIRKTDTNTFDEYIFDWRSGSGTGNSYFFKWGTSGATSRTLRYTLTGGSSIVGPSSDAINSTAPFKAWLHVAISRTSGTTRMFIDGVMQGSFVDNTVYVTNPLTLGNRYNSGAPFLGSISNVRIRIGESYASNFTPPTSALLPTPRTHLLLDFKSYSVLDASVANNITVVGNPVVDVEPVSERKCLYFPGDVDYLNVPYQHYLEAGSGDFTIMCWMKPETKSGSKVIIGAWLASPNSNRSFLLRLLTNNTLEFFYAAHSLTVVFLTTVNTIVVDEFNHVAVIRKNNTIKIYINGVESATGNVSGNVLAVNNTDISIGHSSFAGSVTYQGWMDDIVFVRTALYSEDFTPPATHVSPLAFD